MGWIGRSTSCLVFAFIFLIGGCGESPLLEPSPERPVAVVDHGFVASGPDAKASFGALPELDEQFLGSSLPEADQPAEHSLQGRRHGWRPGGFRLPLQIGNRWSYRRVFAIELRVDGQEPTREVFRSRIEQENIGTELRFGREYVVQEARIFEDPSEPIFEWVRYRQDRTGLFEADVSLSEPPVLLGTDPGGPRPRTLDHLPRLVRSPAGRSALDALAPDPSLAAAMTAAWEDLSAKLRALEQIRGRMAAGGLEGEVGSVRGKDALEDELTRLAYPLRRGSQWVIRASPLFTSEVEGLQLLRLPAGWFPAWRVRIDSEFFEPEDRVVFWFGRVGFLAWASRVHGIATDENGNEIGTLTAVDREVLRRYHIVRDRRAASGGALTARR